MNRRTCLNCDRAIHRTSSIWETIVRNELKATISRRVPPLITRTKQREIKEVRNLVRSTGSCKFLYKYVWTRYKINARTPWHAPLLHFWGMTRGAALVKISPTIQFNFPCNCRFQTASACGPSWLATRYRTPDGEFPPCNEKFTQGKNTCIIHDFSRRASRQVTSPNPILRAGLLYRK